jgi:hypothetical protein
MSDPVKPLDAFVPVQPKVEDLETNCERETGGTKTVQAPKYTLTVTNPVDE